jgi:protein TonB
MITDPVSPGRKKGARPMTTAASLAPVSLLARAREGRCSSSSLVGAGARGARLPGLVWAKLHEEPASTWSRSRSRPRWCGRARRGTEAAPRIEQPPPPPMERRPPSRWPRRAAPARGPLPVPAPPPTKTKQAGEKKADPRQKLLGAFDRMSKSKTPDTTAPPTAIPAATRRWPKVRPITRASARRSPASTTSPTPSRRRSASAHRPGGGGHLPAGQLERARLAKSSGNDLFDSAVMAAVKAPRPSPPPTHLRDALAKYGVVLQFRP